MALVGIINAASTIPSMIVTTIKFRTGVIPSLRDPYFKKYRVGLMKTTGLLGASLWGTIFSLSIIFSLAAGLTFLAVYPVSRWKEICYISFLWNHTQLCVFSMFRSQIHTLSPPLYRLLLVSCDCSSIISQPRIDVLNKPLTCSVCLASRFHRYYVV